MDEAALPDRIDASAARLRERAAGLQPRLALLLGSGWGAAAGQVQDAVDVAYGDLPAFPRLAIGGHAGTVRLGRLGGTPVAVLMGRKHAYESGDADAMKGPIRTLAALGCQTLLQTNAAGGIADVLAPGSLMLIGDHLNFVQRSPLFNESGDSRFVSLADAYDPALRALVRRVARNCGVALHEGVYAWVMGPQFETAAEIRMLQKLGADAVGMSTVPETILARHAGMRVLALSLITNRACGLSDEALSHAHTLHTAAAAAGAAAGLVQAIATAIGDAR
jgi:purine-nucleoside phosphorylase